MIVRPCISPLREGCRWLLSFAQQPRHSAFIPTHPKLLCCKKICHADPAVLMAGDGVRWVQKIVYALLNPTGFCRRWSDFWIRQAHRSSGRRIVICLSLSAFNREEKVKCF